MKSLVRSTRKDTLQQLACACTKVASGNAVVCGAPNWGPTGIATRGPGGCLNMIQLQEMEDGKGGPFWLARQLAKVDAQKLCIVPPTEPRHPNATVATSTRQPPAAWSLPAQWLARSVRNRLSGNRNGLHEARGITRVADFPFNFAEFRKIPKTKTAIARFPF